MDNKGNRKSMTIRRTIALLLSLTLMLSCFTFSAFATETGSDTATQAEESVQPAGDSGTTGGEGESATGIDTINSDPAAGGTEGGTSDGTEGGTVAPGCERGTEDAELEPEPKIVIPQYSEIRSNADLGINNTIDKNMKKAGYRSILIMGVDNDGRADIFIVLVLKKAKNGTYTGNIFSIARDTYFQMLDENNKGLKVNGKDRMYGRANLSYQNGGKLIAMKTLNRNLDLNIKECIAVDWECAAEMVTIMNKTVKGDIKNKSMLTAINDLIKSARKTEQISYSGSFPARIAMLGWQTVEYLRVRSFDGGSTADREARNRTMFRTMFTIAKNRTADQRKDAFYKLADKLDTNMGPEGMDLVGKITKIDDAGAFPYNEVAMWDPAGGHMVRLAGYSKHPGDGKNTLLSNAKTLHEKLYKDAGKYYASQALQTISKKLEWRKRNVLKASNDFKYVSFQKFYRTYNGEEQTVTPVVTMGGIPLVEGSDYTVGNFTTNKNVGWAYYTIYGINSYEGQSRKYGFSIVPVGTSVKGVTSKKRAFNVSWNKQTEEMSTSKITGYQVMYSTSSTFKKGNKWKIVKGCNSSWTGISKLKARTTYYVKVRTYMTVKGKNYYSGWSAAKKVKTK